ncbi:MAG TPA: DUF1697 domain-containing protein [Thermoanaerobaculia bacterium]|nr:DUF1697 domain-containing protein [Thermoanaerobaculia bacterium]
MSKQVAFLRAINVGGHVVKMDQLRRLFEGLGFKNVETFIASGNVIFDAPAARPKSLERKIEVCLREALGYEVATFLRTASALARIAKQKPFGDEDLSDPGHTLYIGFLADPPSAEARRKLLALNSARNAFEISDSEVYWLCRTRFSDSDFSGATLEKTLGMQTTLRNANTVQRLVAKYPT